MFLSGFDESVVCIFERVYNALLIVVIFTLNTGVRAWVVVTCDFEMCF